MIRALAGGAALLLSGCAASPPERVWQALNVIDGAQTVQASKHPACYYEAAPVAQLLVGSHPSPEAAAALAVGFGIVYRLASDWIDERAASAVGTPQEAQWRRGRAFWYGSTIAAKGIVVWRNHTKGLRVGGADCQ